MKKRIFIAVFAWMLAVLLAAGCGNTETPVEEVAAEIEEAEEAAEETEAEPEAEPEEDPEEEELIEEPMPEEAPVEEAAEIPPVPETDEWAANLYNALLADDYKTVMNLTPDPETVREHCAPYEDTSWALWDYETAYRMVMSDGQVMGVILYEFEDDDWEIDSFVSYWDGDGFWNTGYGDHQVTLYANEGYAYLQNGNEVISQSDYQESITLGEDEAYSIWHM